MPETFKVKRLTPDAIIPTRGSHHAAGYDLYCYQPIVIKPGLNTIPIGIAIAIPEGTYARIADRSSLAKNYLLHTFAGVVDFDYRGEIVIMLYNHGDEELELDAGSRIAQLILEKIATPNVVEVEELNTTQRGVGGFGSTGV